MPLASPESFPHACASPIDGVPGAGATDRVYAPECSGVQARLKSPARNAFWRKISAHGSPVDCSFLLPACDIGLVDSRDLRNSYVLSSVDHVCAV